MMYSDGWKILTLCYWNDKGLKIAISWAGITRDYHLYRKGVKAMDSHSPIHDIIFNTYAYSHKNMYIRY
jgi:hypothetical protein